MNKDYEEEKKKAEETVKYAKMSGMVDNITYTEYTYPDKFYLVLEKLDLVMRVWNGEKMGTCGVEELAGLMAILKLDYELLYDMPLEAHVFFRCILNPKNAWEICDKANMGFGYIHRAYSQLRTFLIDNKERVTEAYNKYAEMSSEFTNQQREKYKNKFKEV